MAKSSTKRKRRIKATPEQIVQIKKGVGQALEYVNKWKRQELGRLIMRPQLGSIPVCVPVKKDTYLVGKYGLTRQGDLWQVTDILNENSAYFSQRTSALVYSICSQTKHFQLGKEVLKQDSKVLHLMQELVQINYNLKNARGKKDWWRVDHYYNLCSEIEHQLKEAKLQLEKTISLAKYFKVW